MANYSLVINSRFKPFSYQELLQPALMSTQAHQAVEEGYSELSTKANIWDKMANESTDPKAHAIYKKYANDLQAQADELSKYGLTPTSRQAMLNMRNRYARDIIPIENAYKRREEQAKQQAEIMAKDPTHFFARRASETSLDDFLSQPALDTLTQNYSGALLTQQVSNAAAALAKDARNDPNVRTELKHLLGFNYETIRRTGFDPETVRQAILNSPNANKILTGIVDNVLADSGMNDWNYISPEDKQRILAQARNYANQGLWSAVGQTQYGTVVDDAAKMAAEEAQAKRIARYKYTLEHPDVPANRNRLNPLPLRSSQEVSQNNKDIQEFIRKGYMRQNAITGQWQMTPLGWKEYRRMSAKEDKELALLAAGEASNSGAAEAAKKMLTVPSRFRQFMDKLNGGQSFIDKKGNALPGWGPGRAGNLFAWAIKSNEKDSYDTYHSTEYDRQLDNTYGEAFTKQLWSAAPTIDGKKKLTVVDFNGKNGWKEGDKLGTSDLDGYTVSNVRYSKWGNTAILQKKGEEPIRVRIPKGIHLGVEANINRAISNADDWGLILSRGKRPMTTANGTQLLRDAKGDIIFSTDPLTAEDRIVFLQKQDRALSEMESYGSQLVVPSTTKDEEYQPFGF